MTETDTCFAMRRMRETAAGRTPACSKKGAPQNRMSAARLLRQDQSVNRKSISGCSAALRSRYSASKS